MKMFASQLFLYLVETGTASFAESLLGKTILAGENDVILTRSPSRPIMYIYSKVLPFKLTQILNIHFLYKLLSFES